MRVAIRVATCYNRTNDERTTLMPPFCNCCLRDIEPKDDPGNGLCGPCHRLETPESQG